MTEPEPVRTAPPLAAPETDRQSRYQTLLAGALVLLAALIVAITLGRQSDGPAGTRPVEPPPAEAPSARRAAPVLDLPSLRGPARIRTRDFAGRVVVVNFFASWCAPCELEAADLEGVWQANRARGVAFLGVAIQDRREAAVAFLGKHAVTYPAAIDTDGRVRESYRVTGIPTTIIIDPQGRIASTYPGVLVGVEGRGRLQARIDAAGRSP